MPDDGRRRNALGRIARTLFLLVALLLFGAFGFMLTGGGEWTFLDGLYMSVTTLSTVGLEVVHPLTREGRIFVMVYLFLGLGAFSYGLVQIAEVVLQAQFRQWLGRRRMDSALKSMHDHFIVCGFGRMGRTVCRQLSAKGLPFIAIDRDEASLADAREEGWAALVGDATDDRTLVLAGIERAQGLAAVLASDADNLYVVLSARLLSKRIQIIARASDEKSMAKLEKAGANRVVSLYATGAVKMAQLLANPNVEEFLEVITSRGKELSLTEIQVTPDAPYANQPLSATDFRRLGVIIVGIRRGGKELILPPPSTEVIQPGDFLIALGRAETIADLARKA